jgi:hypothetical protein
MKMTFLMLGIAAAQMAAGVAQAQAVSPAPVDKTEARAQRRAQGIEATREFRPGEGNPEPEARPKATKEERANARVTRKVEGAEASREFQPGEGNPIPPATPEVSRTVRKEERKESRAVVSRENKEGRLPSFSDNYGGK